MTALPIPAVPNGPPAIVGAAASDWLRPLIIGAAQPVGVVGVSGPASYLRAADGTIIALEAAGDGALLPNAVTVGRTGSAVRVGTAGVVGGGMLRVAAHTMRVRRWWDPRPRVGSVDVAHLRRRRLADLPHAIADGHAAFGMTAPIERLAAVARDGDADGLLPVVVELIGRGPGSTPAGDDVLAGLLATLRVCAPTGSAASRFADTLAAHVHAGSGRTTALSATLLRCADAGAVVGAACRVLRMLTGDGPLHTAVVALERTGHTSGRDLLTGITIGVDLLTTGRNRT